MDQESVSNESSCPPPRLTEAEERVARGLVAGVRARLEWLLRIPDWACLCDPGLEQLGLLGRRQGIGLEAAMAALAIEHKFRLVRWLLEHHRKHIPSAVGRRIAAMAGLDPLSELELDHVLSARQWQTVSEALLFRLGQDYRHYKHAQQALFMGHRHLVDRAVGQLVFRRDLRTDACQEGSLALLHAIDRADDSPRQFSAFALCWIRRRLRNFVMEQRLPVYAPVNLIARASAAPVTPAPDQGGAGEPPAPSSGRLEVLLRECLRHPAVSLDEPIDERGGTVAEGLADVAGETPAQAAARKDVHGAVRRSLQVLTAKQRTVVERRFGLAGTGAASLSEIAREAGISHQQAGMRERRALDRLGAVLEPLVLEAGHGP